MKNYISEYHNVIHLIDALLHGEIDGKIEFFLALFPFCNLTLIWRMNFTEKNSV